MPFAPADFTRESFAEALRSEASRLLRHSVGAGLLAPVPEALVYVLVAPGRWSEFSEDGTEVTVPEESHLTEDALLPHLFREEDGHVRGEITLAPFAVTEGATVIEVEIRAGWTDRVHSGSLASPREPFQLRGRGCRPRGGRATHIRR
jgi:hypothetical protein